MRQAIFGAAGLVAGLFLTFAAIAGPAEQACNISDRSPGPLVCRCAQELADQLLSPGDQREVAKIIADPDRFQILATRKNAAAKAFIERYRSWGELTQKHCG